MNIPNLLTVIRMVLVPVFVGLYYGGSPAGALFVYLLACVTDALDGYIARRFNQVTAFGKLMDPLADKLMQLSMLFCLASTGYLPWWALAIMAAKEITMVFGGTFLLKKRNVVVMANWAGKAATVMMIVAIVMIFPWHSIDVLRSTGHVMLDIAIGFSIFAMVNYIMIYVKKKSGVKPH